MGISNIDSVQTTFFFSAEAVCGVGGVMIVLVVGSNVQSENVPASTPNKHYSGGGVGASLHI
jgi:hypothetical protein